MGVIMGHFENGRYVEDPHTKAIKLILEHINTRIAPAFKELADNVNELNKRLNELEGKK